MCCTGLAGNTALKKIAIRALSHNFVGLILRNSGMYRQSELDGCIVWNAHNTVLGEEALLIYIVPVCYVKQVGMEKPSNIVISLHRKNFSIITNIPLIIS